MPFLRMAQAMVGWSGGNWRLRIRPSVGDYLPRELATLCFYGKGLALSMSELSWVPSAMHECMLQRWSSRCSSDVYMYIKKFKFIHVYIEK